MKSIVELQFIPPLTIFALSFFFSLFLPAEANFTNYLFPDSIIIAFGDSITHGTCVSRQNSYPVVLQDILGIKVINEGVPGETISEGLKRLPGVVEKHLPQLVILCEGGE